MDEFIQIISKLLLDPASINSFVISDAIKSSEGKLTNHFLDNYVLQQTLNLYCGVDGWAEKNIRILGFKKESTKVFDPFNLVQHGCLGWQLIFNQAGQCAALGYTGCYWDEPNTKATSINPISDDKLSEVCKNNPEFGLMLIQTLFQRVPEIIWKSSDSSD